MRLGVSDVEALPNTDIGAEALFNKVWYVVWRLRLMQPG